MVGRWGVKGADVSSGSGRRDGWVRLGVWGEDFGPAELWGGGLGGGAFSGGAGPLSAGAFVVDGPSGSSIDGSGVLLGVLVGDKALEPRAFCS